MATRKGSRRGGKRWGTIWYIKLVVRPEARVPNWLKPTPYDPLTYIIQGEGYTKTSHGNVTIAVPKRRLKVRLKQEDVFRIKLHQPTPA